MDRTLYGGTTHEFFGMGAAVSRAREAEAFAAQKLDATFDRIGNPPPPPRGPYRNGVRGARRRAVRGGQHRVHGS